MYSKQNKPFTWIIKTFIIARTIPRNRRCTILRNSQVARRIIMFLYLNYLPYCSSCFYLFSIHRQSDKSIGRKNTGLPEIPPRTINTHLNNMQVPLFSRDVVTFYSVFIASFLLDNLTQKINFPFFALRQNKMMAWTEMTYINDSKSRKRNWHQNHQNMLAQLKITYDTL